ncbi:MAG: acyl-CoA thioesterase [Saprospiraceae bacterium]|nr:acyl-CoA thioesterase [Saprospiraceae bacterium]
MSSTLRSKLVKDSETTMTELVMPNDTNHLGDLMGGNLMKWMDIACAMCASRHTNSAVVTASVDNISFKSSIKLGEICILNAVVTRVFNSSLEVYVTVYAENAVTAQTRKANEAYFTFVSVDSVKHRPVKALPVIPQTPEEVERFEGAQRRRELRLILAGRLKPSQANDLKSLFQ